MYENFQKTIERAQNYPLYSQDGNGKFAKCISIFLKLRKIKTE